MIRSMTGFGRGEAATGAYHATAEIRSVNGRYADVRIKLPQELSGMEHDLVERLKSRARRGRLEVSIQVSRSGGDAPPALEIDRALVASYVQAADALKREFGLSGEVTLPVVLSLPDVMRPGTGRSEPDPDRERALLAAFEEAMTSHDAMRRTEGEILSRDISRRVKAIDALQKKISRQAPKVLPQIAKRLKSRVRDLVAAVGSVEIDPGRMAQEVAVLAERSDITEELVRLRGYLEQLAELLDDAKEPAGKKMDFIMQEMNREANTINSKAIDLAICRDALEIKSEVEKIREQVQNIE